jgi:serine phosphatase RsbU (regulator of sigma subunit)
MSLVLAGADEEPSAFLVDRLSQLGYPVLPARDMQVVMNLCEHALPDAVIIEGLEYARAVTVEHPRVPVVLTCDAPPTIELLLEALRIGVSDVWPLPMGSEELADRLTAVRARKAAVASDAERRLSRLVAELELDQRAGRYIQLGMLPPNPMAIDGFRLQHHILPSLILSGDFVDYFRITDRHFAFYIADVSGHGASSAFVTVLLKNFSRRLRREFRPTMLSEPGEILEWINRELLEQKMDKHVALILGVGDLQSAEIHLVNGGHYPPAILAGAGGSAFVEQKGKPVGLFDEVHYRSQAIAMQAGDRLVMFSDGVMDVMGAQDLTHKEQRLLQAANQGGNVEEMWSLLDMDFNVGNRPDDMTCLLVHRER